MSPAAWVQLFATFAGVAPSIVEAFTAKHPELRDPPPAPADTEIDARIDAELAAREKREGGA